MIQAFLPLLNPTVKSSAARRAQHGTSHHRRRPLDPHQRETGQRKRTSADKPRRVPPTVQTPTPNPQPPTNYHQNPPWVTRVQTPTNTKPVSIPNKTPTPNTQPRNKLDTKHPTTNNTNKTQQNPQKTTPKPKIYKEQGHYVSPGMPLHTWV